MLSLYDMAKDAGTDVSGFYLDGLATSLSGLEGLQGAFASIGQLMGMLRMVGSLSRKLREPCDRMRAALVLLTDSDNTFERWSRELQARL